MGSPFFSPDGESVGFFENGQLKRVGVERRRSDRHLCDHASARRQLGSRQHDSLRSAGGHYARVRQWGHAGTRLSRPTKTSDVRPAIAARRGLGVFSITTGIAQTRWDAAQIVVQSLKSGNRTVVMTGGSDARWTQSGHRRDALGHAVPAVPFNPDTLRVGGSPVVAIEGVRRGYRSGSVRHYSVQRVEYRSRACLRVRERNKPEPTPGPGRSFGESRRR